MASPEKPILHVVFGTAAAGAIRQALGQVGRVERVIGCPDNLSFGPIDPPEVRRRSIWVKECLFYDLDEALEQAEVFWAEATSPHVRPFVWVCRNHAAEYAGFLEFLRRIGKAPFRLVDASDVQMPGSDPPATAHALTSLGLMNARQIIEAGLLERNAVLPRAERTRYRAQWQRLRKENAALRVVSDEGLVSVWISYFDETILSCATHDWRKAALVVGTAMVELRRHCLSDLLVWSRVLALAEAGTLDVRGDPPTLRSCEVRLAPRSR